MLEQIYIYGLIDPRTDKVRYVGQTRRLEIRYGLHLTDAFKTQARSAKSDWIKELLQCATSPQVFVFETVFSREEAKKRERAWIEAFCATGNLLTNARMNSLVPESEATLAGRRKGQLGSQLKAAESRRQALLYREKRLLPR